jgi:hypothetical protein
MDVHFTSLPGEAIASAGIGSEVKLTGVINSSRQVALDYHEESSGKNGHTWAWNEADTFKIDDSTGSIRVDCSRYYDIKDSGVVRQHTPHVAGRVYLNGTHVMVIGHVVSRDGGRILQLEYMQPGSGTIPFDPLYILPAFLILLSIFACLARAFWFRNKQHQSHDSKLAGVTEAGLPAELTSKDTAAEWRSNHGPDRKGRMPTPSGVRSTLRRIFSTMVIFGIMADVAILFLASPHKPGLYYVMMAVMLVSAIFFLFPGMFAFSSEEMLVVVGICDRGIHFWYEPPSRRLLNIQFIPWDKVKSIGETGEGKRRHWAIKYGKDDELGDTDLTTQTKQWLGEAWAARMARRA